MTARRWTGAALASAAALVLMVERTPGQANKMVTPPPAAIVNGEPIAFADIDAVLAMMPPMSKEPTETQLKQMRTEAVDMLIDDVLIRQFLNRAAAPASKAEINKEYQGLLAGLKTRNMTMEAFLKDTKQTEPQLRQDIVKKVQWANYLKQHISEASLKQYFDENRDFYDRVTVQVSHILFRLQLASPDKNQAKARLSEIRQQILANQISFADAAKKYSQCQSASSGGDIGKLIRKWVVDERIAKVAFAMKVGEISDPVETDAGVHLLKVTARDPGQPAKFEKIKELVRENLAMELWHNLLNQERKIAKIEIKLP